MEVICIDDKYSIEVLDFWKQFGIERPILNKIYSIREVVKHFDGSIGLWLEEIINPKVPISHPILGNIEYEPTFSYKRFAKLNGDLIAAEKVRELTYKTIKTY